MGRPSVGDLDDHSRGYTAANRSLAGSMLRWCTMRASRVLRVRIHHVATRKTFARRISNIMPHSIFYRFWLLMATDKKSPKQFSSHAGVDKFLQTFFYGRFFPFETESTPPHRRASPSMSDNRDGGLYKVPKVCTIVVASVRSRFTLRPLGCTNWRDYCKHDSVLGCPRSVHPGRKKNVKN